MDCLATQTPYEQGGAVRLRILQTEVTSQAFFDSTSSTIALNLNLA
ncbi:hypothetical protein SynBIOSE41_02111 [Synechococcus sp. BIOS-E4-1]|nr:hypothetical protein SynBIOSE41_02111 [Synechococcus sp. BIOS-E4-1]